MKLTEISENINIFNQNGNSSIENLISSIDFLKNNKLPNTKNEQWKYTSLSSLNGIDFSFDVEENFNEREIDDVIQNAQLPANSVIIPVLNGKLLSNSLANDKRFKVEIHNISKLNEQARGYHQSQSIEADYFYHLNTVLAQKEILLKVHSNSEPIYFVFLFISKSENNSFISPLVNIELNKNAQAKIAFKFVSLSTSDVFTNLFSQIILNENSSLDFYLIEDNLDKFQAINNINIIQDRDSKFVSNIYTNRAKFIRNFQRIYLSNENSEAVLNGLFIGNDNDLIDNHIMIEHIKPNCFSNQLFKGILNQNSIGIFNGAVLVHPNAQKTNAFQVNRNIMTSDSAKVYTKPELEIYADDVKCSHGEATGFIDDEMLFYMRSRGISEEKAKKLLLQAFALDVINKFGWEEIKNLLITNISRELEI